MTCSPAILWSFVVIERRERSEDPWLCVPEFPQVCFFRIQLSFTLVLMQFLALIYWRSDTATHTALQLEINIDRVHNYMFQKLNYGSFISETVSLVRLLPIFNKVQSGQLLVS